MKKENKRNNEKLTKIKSIVEKCSMVFNEPYLTITDANIDDNYLNFRIVSNDSKRQYFDLGHMNKIVSEFKKQDFKNTINICGISYSKKYRINIICFCKKEEEFETYYSKLISTLSEKDFEIEDIKKVLNYADCVLEEKEGQ